VTQSTRILAIANQKGGVGKTTTALNLAAGLVALKRRVLLIDMDPQGNCTTGLGVELEDDQPTTGDVMTGAVALNDAIVRPASVELDLLPASGDLTAAEVELMEREDRAGALKAALAGIGTRYDDVIIDCPPALNVLTLNALTAATGHDPDAVRVLRAGGPDGAGRHHRADPGLGQSGPGDRRPGAHHVRHPQQPVGCCRSPAGRELRRQALQHDRAAQRARGRVAELRRVGD
jgi:hypothetical protein